MIVKEEIVARTKRAELIKRTDDKGRWTYRLMHRGKFVADDYKRKYLYDIMFQLDASAQPKRRR